MTPEAHTTKPDDLGPNASDGYDFESITVDLETLGFAVWRPTSSSRKFDLLARHRDGTIVRLHREKHPVIEFDYSRCEQQDGAAARKSVVIELRESRNWRLTIWHWAINRWADFRWTLYIAPFWIRGNILYPIKQLRLRYKTSNRLRRLKPIYSEPPTTESEWRGWGL